MNENDDKEKRVQEFLELNRKSARGKLKIYLGMSAGVGKTYRMLQEAHTLFAKRRQYKNWLCRNAWKKGNTGINRRASGYSTKGSFL